jgi:hypothetical protein
MTEVETAAVAMASKPWTCRQKAFLSAKLASPSRCPCRATVCGGPGDGRRLRRRPQRAQVTQAGRSLGRRRGSMPHHDVALPLHWLVSHSAEILAIMIDYAGAVSSARVLLSRRRVPGVDASTCVTVPVFKLLRPAATTVNLPPCNLQAVTRTLAESYLT